MLSNLELTLALLMNDCLFGMASWSHLSTKCLVVVKPVREMREKSRLFFEQAAYDRSRLMRKKWLTESIF
jgi:hypothetical protein